MARAQTHIGRPSALKLAPQVGEEIVKALRAGVPLSIACLAEGISYSTVRMWIERGSQPSARDPYATFAREAVQARAEGARSKVVDLSRVAHGGFVVEETEVTHPDGRVERRTRRQPPDWRASAWWLERQFRDEFGRIETLQMTGPDGQALPVVSLAELAARNPRAHEQLESLTDEAIEGEWSPVE